MQERQAYRILMITEREQSVSDFDRLLGGTSPVEFNFTHISPEDLASGQLNDMDYDVGLHELQGCEPASFKTIAQLHRKFPQLPLIVLGDKNNPEESLLALRQGAQDYLSRAEVDAERLYRSMQFAIERIRHSQISDSEPAYEPLTGLANRLLLNDRLQEAIKRANRNETGIAVLYIDIDNFHEIDQQLGRESADEILRHAAACIRNCLRDSDTLARVGPDDFVVLLEAMNHTHGAVAVSEKILKTLDEGLVIDDETVPVRGSIGVVLYPQCGEDFDDLVYKADMTRCRALRDGGNRYCIYTEEMDQEFLHNLGLEDDLLHALERDEFRLFFQPKFNLHNGRVSGTEALLRWHHPESGILSPGNFMRFMEDKEIIKSIGRWVLETACETNKRWHERGLCVGPVAVNIAGKQLLDKNFIHQVEAILNRTGLPSCLLELEITEATLIENVAFCRKQLKALREIGVSIAIDDFGTGYSSFNYLRNFLVDTIKIDRSFIKCIARGGPETAITTAIISLAKDLRVNVVAEGVENLEQFRILYELAADDIQGNFLSPAMSAGSMHNYLLTNGLSINPLFEPDLRMAI